MWRQYEYGFGKIELTRYRLHLIATQMFALAHDSKLISRKRLLRENIENKKRTLHG